MAKQLTKVRLESARVGQRFDDRGRPLGFYSQAVGDEVTMSVEEAQRYIDRGLASPINEK